MAQAAHSIITSPAFSAIPAPRYSPDSGYLARVYRWYREPRNIGVRVPQIYQVPASEALERARRFAAIMAEDASWWKQTVKEMNLKPGISPGSCNSDKLSFDAWRP